MITPDPSYLTSTSPTVTNLSTQACITTSAINCWDSRLIPGSVYRLVQWNLHFSVWILLILSALGHPQRRPLPRLLRQTCWIAFCSLSASNLRRSLFCLIHFSYPTHFHHAGEILLSGSTNLYRGVRYRKSPLIGRFLNNWPFTVGVVDCVKDYNL